MNKVEYLGGNTFQVLNGSSPYNTTITNVDGVSDIKQMIVRFNNSLQSQIDTNNQSLKSLDEIEETLKYKLTKEEQELWNFMLKWRHGTTLYISIKNIGEASFFNTANNNLSYFNRCCFNTEWHKVNESEFDGKTRKLLLQEFCRGYGKTVDQLLSDFKSQTVTTPVKSQVANNEWPRVRVGTEVSNIDGYTYKVVSLGNKEVGLYCNYDKIVYNIHRRKRYSTLKDFVKVRLDPKLWSVIKY